VLHHATAGLALALAVTGCAGPRQNLRSENHQLELTVGDLRAEARRERARVHDLENQVALLQDKLETAQLAAREGVPEPRLPVEVLEPARAAQPPADPDYKVVGVDDQGNEIVYVGDAARDTSVTPSMDDYDDAPRPRPVAAGPPITEPRSGDDRIPVTGAVPTIDDQMRGARAGKPAPRPAPVVEADPETLYHRHQAALRAGHHAEAIAGFRDFLARFPHHDYADNAQYWLGEAYYDQKQYRQAMAEFRKVVKDYPRGNKVPDALLKVGYCYAALGEQDKARDVLGQVVALYPTSAPARLASQKLAELGGGKEQP